MKIRSIVSVGSAFIVLTTAVRAALPLSWELSKPLPTNMSLFAVTFGNGRFVAAGDNRTIMTSENGLDWTLRTNGPAGDFFLSTAFGNGRFVAGGRSGALLATSTDDGLTWLTVRTATATGAESVLGLAFGNGLFVGVGHGIQQETAQILTSSDGLNWQFPVPPTTNALHAIAFANNRFVAVGERGTIVTSVDGVNWTIRNSGTAVLLRAITHNGSYFIAGGDLGTVLTSTDGITWTSAAPASFDIYALGSGGGAVVAAGYYLGAGRLHVSPDGLTWPGDPNQFSYPLRGVAYRPDYFVVVGEYGVVLRSSGFTPGAANFWTKATSGNWSERFWSLGEPPNIIHPVIVFDNPGFKALAIEHATTLTHPTSLNIRNLVVDAPADSANLLLLNYAGLDTPLQVRETFRIGRRGALLSYASWLIASNMIVDGRATFAEFGRTEVPRLSLGQSAPGELTLSNGWFQSLQQTVSVSYASTFNQYGGTNYTRGLDIGEGGSYNLHGGDFIVEFQGDHPGVWMSGGVATVSGGSFSNTLIVLAPGSFRQSGGTSTVHTVQFNARGSDTADLVLSGGELTSIYIEMGHRFGFENTHGTFTQSGGFHTNMGGVGVNTNSHYTLSGGISAIDGLGIDGAFEQTGGTNVVRNINLGEGGRYHFMGGHLLFGTLTLGQRSQFYRRGTFVNEGQFTPRIHISGGTFFAGAGSNQAALLSFGAGDPLVQSMLDLERNGPSILNFSGVGAAEYSTLLITNWAGSLDGGGADRIYVGTNATAISGADLERIGFAHPVGLPGGIYMARILPSGEIVPSLARPQIRSTRVPGYIQLEWNSNFYELLTATNVAGPWEAYSWARSQSFFMFSDPQRYFQLRSR